MSVGAFARLTSFYSDTLGLKPLDSKPGIELCLWRRPVVVSLKQDSQCNPSRSEENTTRATEEILMKRFTADFHFLSELPI